MASLYDRYDLYDLVAPRDEAMEGFYVGEARANGPRVLELACGSGRLTLPLARAGLEVVGIDLAEPMLERTRGLAAAEGLTVETHRLDMRDFELGRQFDTVMIAGNSILHLLTRSDFEGFFRSVARHVSPSGKLLFDCFVPSAHLLSRPRDRQAMVRATHAKLGEVTIEEIVDYDPLTQIARTNWYWSTASQPDFHITTFDLRSIYPQELPLLLSANGFRLLDRFGGFDKVPFAMSAFRQVCIAAPS